MKYLVSHQGQESGPFTMGEIVERVRNRQLELFDYIFDENKADWILLMEHPEVAENLKSAKPPRPQLVKSEVKPVAETATEEDAAHLIAEWFVMKGENRFGPFAFKEVIKMLQQKIVFPFDFIWHAGMNDWKRIAETDDFQPEALRKILEEANGKDIFVKRQFQRLAFEGRVLVHDNFKYWKGKGLEISQGGVGITLDNPLIVPGQQLHVHFSAQDSWPAFNALCEVVSKKFVSDNSPVTYGLRFLSLSHEAQAELTKRAV